jgi:hypothetical protein
MNEYMAQKQQESDSDFCPSSLAEIEEIITIYVQSQWESNLTF